MKKVLYRKLLSDYLSFFLIALLSTSIIIWVFQAVNYLDIMIEDGRDYLVYINYSLLNFPKIVSKVFPFALFFSLFYVTTRSEFNNELIMLWNFGIHKIKIVNFIIKLSISMLVLQLALTVFIVPKAQDKARSFLRTSDVNFFDNFIKQQKFNDTIKGVTIYTDKKDNDGNLVNLYLKKEIDNGFQITYAKKGVIKKKGNVPIIVLYSGATITSKKKEITNISFSKSDFSFLNTTTNTTTYKKTQEISSDKIVRCIKNFYTLEKKEFEIIFREIENCSYQNMQSIIKEIYKRFIIPFYIPLLSLIPILLITSSKENLNYNKVRLFTFLTGLVIIIFSETTIRYVSKISIYDVCIMIIPFMLFLFLYLFFLKKFDFNLKT